MKFLKILFLILPTLVFAQKAKPNIVFLLVDDLGYGDFSCYGAKFNETPHIDKLAKKGMKFTNAYAACTVCSPSRAAILTGKYPARLKLTDWIAGHVDPKAKLLVPDWNMRLEHSEVLLPEALKEAGYNTAFVGKWHLMPDGQPDFGEHYPTSHGFDINIGGREWGQPKGRGKYFPPFDMPNLDDGKPGDFLTDKLTDAAINIMDTFEKSKPFLLYFSYYTLHSPVMAPDYLVKKYEEKAKDFKFTANSLRNPARAGMVEKLDESIGRIQAKLEEMGIADNTIIVLTGDNGGDYPETSGGMRDYKGFSHDGGTREPLIVSWPGKIKPNQITDQIVMGTDFYPTLLELAGIELKPAQHLDGISFKKVLANKNAKLDREDLYWHYPHYHRTKPYGAIRCKDWKLIEFFEDETFELYNLKSDPTEKNNLVASNPKKKEELLAKLQTWRASVGAQMMTQNPNYEARK